MIDDQAYILVVSCIKGQSYNFLIKILVNVMFGCLVD